MSRLLLRSPTSYNVILECAATRLTFFLTITRGTLTPPGGRGDVSLIMLDFISSRSERSVSHSIEQTRCVVLV